MLNINNIANIATNYTATIMSNPTYTPADENRSEALYFDGKMNGKPVRIAMHKGVVNAFLKQADGKAIDLGDNKVDFRDMKITCRGSIGTNRFGGKFLNVGYILKVEAKAAPSGKAETVNFIKAETAERLAATANSAPVAAADDDLPW